MILNPQRAGRLIEYHARDASNPGLEEVIETLVSAAWRASPKTGLQREIADVVRLIALRKLIGLAMDANASVAVRSIATTEIHKQKRLFTDSYSSSLVAKFEEDPRKLDLPKPVEAPPGQPIGSDDYDFWPF